MLLSIMFLLWIVGCSNQQKTADYKTDTVVSNDYENDTNNQSEKEISQQFDTDISEIYISIMGNKSKVNIDNDILDLIEQSKSVKEPKLDENAIEVGDLTIVYKDSDKEISFGKIYVDIKDKVYFMCNSNKNNAVIEISQNDEYVSGIAESFSEKN